jgi:protein arginine kinase activator
MICQFCKKNVATVHLTEFTDGKKQEVHLCEECARKKGLSVKTNFSLQDLLSSLMAQKKESFPEEVLQLKCPSCGLTFSQFRESGRFGCPQDYHVFQKGLIPLLERIHGSSRHFGKVPEKIDSDTAKERALLDLRNQLEDAIQHEEYERAAQLRDRIRAAEADAESSEPEAKAPRKSRKKNAGKSAPSEREDEDAVE